MSPARCRRTRSGCRTANLRLARLAAAGLTGLGCLVLAGCSTGESPGPLGGPYSQGLECAVLAGGQVLSDGFDVIENPGDAPATIEAVSLAAPHDLRLLAAYIVPIAGSELYGVRSGYPPAAGLDPAVLWSRRHVAVGATVPHSDSNHVSNLVMVLKATASTGTASGTQISYRLAGRDYRFEIKTGVMIVIGRACPSS